MRLLQHRVLDVFRQGGLYRRVMTAGSQMNRMQGLLKEMAGAPRTGAQRPFFYCPGLTSAPYWDTTKLEGCQYLEDVAGLIQEAWDNVREDLLTYVPSDEPDPGRWCMLLLRHMGCKTPMWDRNQELAELIDQTPGHAMDYAWGDGLVSLHVPGTHLHAHCSIDNLRIRIHMGFQVPAESRIRVHNTTKNWERHRCLAFDDSYEHETWNESTIDRTVLVLDLWHPDLTQIEREFLIAAFNKREVRDLMVDLRIRRMTMSEQDVSELKRRSNGLDVAASRSGWWD